MNTIELQSLQMHPVGRTIANALSNLTNGNYALVPGPMGTTNVLKLTPSHGTPFYRFHSTVNLPFEGVKKSKLLKNYPVELNASPRGSYSQEYAMDALIFCVA